MKWKFTKFPSKKQSDKSGIYLIEIGTHSYVGSTKSFFNRWQDHRKSCRRGHGVNNKFQRCYNKYGEDNIYVSILESVEESLLLEREEFWIKKLNPDLNLCKTPTIIGRTIPKMNTKSVFQYSLEGIYITEYSSVMEAAKSLNVKSCRNIAAAACVNCRVKSAHGFQWSYIKIDKIPKYTNNSNKAVNTKIFILDLESLIEKAYDSIADAVRDIHGNINFDSECATLSSVAHRKQSFYKNRYMARYDKNKYYFTSRKSAVVNTIDNKIFSNAKVAAEFYSLNKDTIRAWCKNQKNGWIYLEDSARVKFRESGKLQYWTTLIEDL